MQQQFSPLNSLDLVACAGLIAEGPVLLDVGMQALVSGGSPKGGWDVEIELDTDPSPKGGW